MEITRRVQFAWKILTTPARDWPSITLDEWASYFSLDNWQGFGTILRADQEQIDATFSALTRHAYRSNGIVFSCMIARQFVFSQARFKWRQIRNGIPGGLFGNTELARLEVPWQNGSTTDLLNRMIQDADLAGNSYTVRSLNGVRRLRPDWVNIVVGSPTGNLWDAGAEVIGYVYYPGGKTSGNEPVTYLPEVIAHWAPIPDPEFRWRGMSWLAPVVSEIMADKAATTHKLKFFENGATPNLVVKLDLDNLDKFDAWVGKLEEQHKGLRNAYKSLYLGAGAEATVVGSSLQQMDFKVTQGAGETRIASAAGMHPVIVGLSEGLAGSSLNAGNFNSARRLTADKTFRPLWQGACEKLQTIMNVPDSAELWYYEAGIPFLQEDQKDQAEIQQVNSTAIRTLVDAGFDPESVKNAVITGDFTQLKHSGLFSVQLQPPSNGTIDNPVPTPAAPAPAAKAPANNGAQNGRDYASLESGTEVARR